MRIWCLTSLTVEYFSNKGYPNLSDDYFKDARADIIAKFLKNAQNYELSEIRIGKREYNFYFLFYRNGIKILDILMQRGAITILRREDKKQDYIDILISKRYNDSKEYSVHYLQKIRIREIKNTSNKCKITSDEEQMYIQYSKWINEFCNGNPEREYEAFKLKGPLIFSKQCKQKPLNQKITDLYDAINDCCNFPITNKKIIDTSKNRPVLQKKRYDVFLKNDETYIFEKHSYEAIYEERKDFLYCQKLSYDSINLAKINDNWFLAKGLLSLSFTNMELFKYPGTCQNFAKNIHKLEHLSILELNHCKIREIPDYIYDELPIWLTYISLENNYIKKISPLILRLHFLRRLSLANNFNLSDDGISWKHLPESLEELELGKTNLTKIPLEAKGLENLRILGIEIPNLKEIECEEIIKYMDGLSLSNPTILKDHTAERASKITLESVGLSDLDEIMLNPWVKELKLPINAITSWDINWKKYTHLTTIDLSHNMLTWIPWETLPSTLESITFTNNFLERVGSLNNLRNLKHLFLQHNMINEIEATDIYLLKIKSVNLSYNQLTELPFGFESMWNPENLDLSYNKFTATSPVIDLEFWDRLPGAVYLNISGNNIAELSCQLTGKTFNLIAKGCNLKYICPQIYNIHFEKEYKDMIFINISKNDDLKTMTFIPHIFHPVAGANEKPSDEHLHFDNYEAEEIISRLDDGYVERSVIVSDNPKLKNTQRSGKLIQYDFKEVEENINEKKSLCKCCAYCKNSEAKKQETVMIEQCMMMGCVLAVVNENECKKDKIFYNPGWQAGKWKALIRTRLCRNCIQELKTKADEANKTFVQPEKLPKKQRTAASESIPNIPELHFPVLELIWIQYVINNQPAYFEDLNLIYYYPSEEYLQGICFQHGLPFQLYVFVNYTNYYGSNIYNSKNLLTIKIIPDHFSGFKALAYLLTGTVESFLIVKTLINSHITSGFMSQRFYTMYHHQIKTAELSIKECELYAAANLFQLNILIFNYKNNGKWFILNESCIDREDGLTFFLTKQPSILLSIDVNGNYNAVLVAQEQMQLS